jgi:hypothetical protein
MELGQLESLDQEIRRCGKCAELLARYPEDPPTATSATIADKTFSCRRRSNRIRAGFADVDLSVQTLAHILASLENRDALLINRYMHAGARIAAIAR